MNEITLEVNRFKAVLALTYIARENLSQKEAAEKAGFSKDTFLRTLERHPELAQETISKHIAKLNVPLQELVDDIIKARVSMVKRFIQDAEDPELSLKDRLALDARLDMELERIKRELSLIEGLQASETPQGSSDAARFLAQIKPPQLKRGKGVVTVKETTTSVEFEQIAEEPGEIIDIEETS